MELDINYLYALTPRQFSNIQVGWNQKTERQTKTSWEQVRTIYDAVIRPHLKSKNKSIREILPFPWDQEDILDNTQEEGFEEMKGRWDKIDQMKREKL